MNSTLRHRTRQFNLLAPVVIVAVLAMAFLLGQRASATWLALLVAGMGALALLQTPLLGPLAIVAAALLVPREFGTGTEVKLNTATLLVPALLALGMLDMVRRRQIRLVSSRTNLPLTLFLAAGLFSLFFGIVTWDPIVPRSSNFLLVQLAQWGIFTFSAGAFWLTANLIKDEFWLRRLTMVFLLLAGGVALVSALPFIGPAINRFTTVAFIRAPLWALLTALAGGQLFYNRKLSPLWRIFLAVVLIYTVFYGFVVQRDSSSTWAGVGAALGMLVWLRFPRLRILVVLAIAAMSVAGILIPGLWNFAGGDEAWASTGGSRVALINRVIEVTMRNPVTGLGPAAYRVYGAVEPLKYRGAFWVVPQVSSHNNYVDLFSQGGIVGMALFLWFAIEVGRIGARLRKIYSTGFTAGYVNGTLAVGVASLVLMVFADWILPFVYNIGFPGFQASVLVWLFLGGLVALDQIGTSSTQQDSAPGVPSDDPFSPANAP